MGVRSTRTHNLKLHWYHRVYLMEDLTVVLYMEIKGLRDRHWEFHGEQWF